MDNIVTLDQLLNLANDILQNATSNQNYNDLIEESIFKQYDILEDKRKLLNMLATFKSARYLYDFPQNYSTICTYNYENLNHSKLIFSESKLENTVEKYIDKQLLITDIYNSLIKLSFKLTENEAIYLVNTFIATKKSEEKIAEIIGVSKVYLQIIKKSCIMKMKVDLMKYCEGNNF